MSSGPTQRRADPLPPALETVVVKRVRVLAGGFKPGADVTPEAPGSSPPWVMPLGGEPMDGRRHAWRHSVSNSRERIELAREDRKAGRFAPVPEETELIRLPESVPAVVRYP